QPIHLTKNEAADLSTVDWTPAFSMICCTASMGGKQKSGRETALSYFVRRPSATARMAIQNGQLWNRQCIGRGPAGHPSPQRRDKPEGAGSGIAAWRPGVGGRL